MNAKFVPASFSSKSFHCPRCGVFARQHWCRVYDVTSSDNANAYNPLWMELWAVKCEHCSGYELWWKEQMILPDSANAPLAHPEMPADIRHDFDEARSVLARSPRSAAALLRLSIQKLCMALGEPGKNINADIAALVEKGLPVMIQQALDIVRVVGNEQVHPGELDVRDDPEVALRLFELVNLIVEDRIARPKQIADLYLKLPQSKRDAIEKRDA